MGVELTLIGSVTIRRNGDVIQHLAGAQAQVALARLTLDRAHGVSRDQLADTIWPRRLPTTWESALRTIVSRIRAFVGSVQDGTADPLVVRAGRYVLHLPDDVVVDVEAAGRAVASARTALEKGETEHARQLAEEGVARLRGPFVPGHPGEWADEVRDQLAELLVNGLELMGEAAAQLGEGTAALAAASEAVARAPLRESAHRCRMIAHAAAGNRAEALRAYQDLRRVLAEEMGVDPAPETEAAYLGLLGSAQPASQPKPSGHAGRSVRPQGQHIAFVGRQVELATLDECWSRASAPAARPVVALVSGEAGIGKSRLISEVARRHAAEARLVVLGQCEPEVLAPYQPLVDALEGIVRAAPEDVLPRLSRQGRTHLGTLLPSLDTPRRHGAPPERAELFDAAVELVEAAARDRPVVLILEDLQCADGDTLLLLRHLLQRITDARLLVVVTTTRHHLEPSHPLTTTCRTLERDGALCRVPLGGLETTAIRQLVESAPPQVGEAGALAEQLAVDTAGNPFLLVELLRASARVGTDAAPSGAIPPHVTGLITTRLAGLDPSARTLMRAAAVAGPTFELDLTAAAVGFDEATALDAMEAGLADGLVVPVGEPQVGHQYRFAHEVARRVIQDQLSPARRRQLHALLAEAIEERRADALEQYLPALAHHRAAGAPPTGDRGAVHWIRLAAAKWREQRAFAEVVRLYRAALDVVPRDDDELRTEVLAQLGLAQVEAGDAEAEQSLLEAVLDALRHGRLDVAARAALGLSDLARMQPSRRTDIATVVDDVVTALERTGQRAEDDAERAGSGPTTLCPDDLVRARLSARRIELRGGRDGGGEPSAEAVSSAAHVLSRELGGLQGPGALDRRRALAEELASLGIATGDGPSQMTAAHHQAMVAAVTGDWTRTDEALRSMGRAGGTANRHLVEALLAEREAAMATAQGRFAGPTVSIAAPVPRDEAGAGADQVVRRSWGLDELPPGSVVVRQRVVADWLRGRPRGQPPAGDEGGYDAAELGLLALLRGDRGRAHVIVRSLALGAEPLPEGDQWLHAVGLVSLAAVELADPATAEPLIELLSPHRHLTCGIGYRSFVAPASFHLGRLATVVGEWADAERDLLAALRQLSAIGARPWIALAQLALADVLQARGSSSDRESVDALRTEAWWTADRLGLRRPSPRTGDAPSRASGS